MRLQFKERIQFFQAKRNVLTESWLDVDLDDHDSVFTVPGIRDEALLADFRTAVDQVIVEGKTLAEFRRDFDRIVSLHGWRHTGGRNWQSRVIYETNLRQSYNAGRWHQLQALNRARPYWQYKQSDSGEHPGPNHASWDGLVLRADDQWWQTHFPANGWGCQCYVQALNERDLQRMGKTVGTAPPIEWVETEIDGRTIRTPIGIDPGFAYAPGRRWVEQLAARTAILA